MTLTDVRRTIKESPNPDWYNNVQEVFQFPYVDLQIPLKGVSTIYDFADRQVEGWSRYSDLPSVLIYSKEYFNGIKQQIIYFFTHYSGEADSGNLDIHWNKQVKNHIANTSNRFPLRYNSPEAEFLLDLHEKFPRSLAYAWNFIVGTRPFQTNTQDAVIGVNLAYEFIIGAAKSKMAKRTLLEKRSFENLSEELEKKIAATESMFAEYLTDHKRRDQEYIKSIDHLKTQKENEVTAWFNESQRKFDAFDMSSQNRIEALESAYSALLSLKKPADYWKQRATELKKEGWKSLNWAIALTIGAVFILFLLLWISPDTMLKSFYGDDKSLAVRWSIIFVTLISFLAFGLRSLLKVTFSSFHLARDAEERERLTYVYLALIKDEAAGKEDRQLIMQSLFSRADTGLLKEDSSPTMPGILDKIK